MTVHSATLAIDEAIRAQRASGRRILHLGFGEAGVPVLPEVREVLARSAPDASYGPVAGTEVTRQAVAAWFTRRGVPTQAHQIIVAPGSKPLLFALIASLPGSLVLPKPAWVSYAAQAAFVGKSTVRVPIHGDFGGVCDTAALQSLLTSAATGEAGEKAGSLLLTIPDNPTGTTASLEVTSQNIDLARRHGLAVISDEIYADVVHSGEAPHPVELYPERTIVTSGLSKSQALGGYRIGFARVPDNSWGADLMSAVIGVASEVWSALAAPMQHVLTYVAGEPPEVIAHRERATRLHGLVSRAVHERFIAAGARCRPPTAGFYLYPDFSDFRDHFKELGIHTSEDLARHLLDTHGVGVLAGSSFGDDPERLTLRVATSLLYGSDEDQRWQALAAADPLTLPWIAENLDFLGHVLSELMEPL